MRSRRQSPASRAIAYFEKLADALVKPELVAESVSVQPLPEPDTYASWFVEVAAPLAGIVSVTLAVPPLIVPFFDPPSVTVTLWPLPTPDTMLPALSVTLAFALQLLLFAKPLL